MKNEIYVLIMKDKRNKNEDEWTDCAVFVDLETAQQRLIELKNDFMQEIKNELDNYTIEDNSDEILPYFSAYENGFYDENHFDLAIYQREVQ